MSDDVQPVAMLDFTGHDSIADELEDKIMDVYNGVENSDIFTKDEYNTILDAAASHSAVTEDEVHDEILS